jgi:hypothetical protein
MKRFEGKVALITASSTGIGFAIGKIIFIFIIF